MKSSESNETAVTPEEHPQEHTAMVSAFANCLRQCVLIVNIRTRGIDFAANTQVFGPSSSQDAMAMGFMFFTKHTDEAGLATLHEIERAWENFFSTHKEADQRDYAITCCLDIYADEAIHHCRATFSPFGFGDCGEVVSAICTIEPNTTYLNQTHMTMHDNHTGEEHIYTHESKRWCKKQKTELTEQESKVIQLFANGLSAKEIAEMMNISVHTVNYHKKKLFEKFGVNSMAQVAALVL